jgi:hypothetical protein
MPEWNFEEIEGDVRVTHWHPDGKRHPASVVMDQGRRRRAECDDCHAVVAVDRATEQRLIADESADALAYDDSEQPA